MTDMQRLLNELEELRVENSALKSQKSDFEYQKNNLKKLCAELQSKVKNSESEKRELTDEISKLKQENITLNAELTEYRFSKYREMNTGN